jgi:hypothetical protein
MRCVYHTRVHFTVLVLRFLPSRRSLRTAAVAPGYALLFYRARAPACVCCEQTAAAVGRALGGGWRVAERALCCVLRPSTAFLRVYAVDNIRRLRCAVCCAGAARLSSYAMLYLDTFANMVLFERLRAQTNLLR